MADDPLYRDPELVQFYDCHGPWGDDMEFCRHMSGGIDSVLDLGCGTGVFLTGLDRSKRRTGVDPATAMLDVARARPGGEPVTWVEGDGRTVRLGDTFDLVVMTGHAFQVFLDDEDMRAVCETIAMHLSPTGRFVFDSRNPARAEWREWVPERSADVIEHPVLGAVECWNDVREDARHDEVIVYETHYRVRESGKTWSAESGIRFAPKNTIDAALRDAGLRVETWLGNWRGAAYTPDAREIIPVGRLAR